MRRADPFGDLTDLAPKPQAKPVNAADITRIAEENGFPSRQPQVKPTTESVRPRRRFTTGRNQQLNIKATSATCDLFYRLVDEWGSTQGELLEDALAALVKQGPPDRGRRRGQGRTDRPGD